MKLREPLVILMADDDADDRLLTRDALRESAFRGEIYFVNDGEALLSYLRREGAYSDTAAAPFPDVILLDLNMPRKSGREALAEIKADPTLRRTPVLIMTTSSSSEDISSSYSLGAAGYITKPVTFRGLVEVMSELGRYWGDTAELPNDG